MGIVKKVERVEDVKFMKGSFPVKFAYTMPEHHEKFFVELKKKGNFTGGVCDKCGKVYVPPVMFCEECFVRVKKIVKIPATGILEAFTVTDTNAHGDPLPAPQVFGLIRLQGASTVLMHKVLAPAAKCKIGMKVKARLVAANKRKGSITDIEGFAPA